MAVQLNHTIVSCTDQERSANYLADVLGLAPPKKIYGFDVVETSNDLSLDFRERGGDFDRQHYAFLVSEDEFDAIFSRIEAAGTEYWADPGRTKVGRINTHDGGRGVYWPDPDGHLLEVITRPYGSGSSGQS